MTWNRKLEELTLPDLLFRPQAEVRALQDRLLREQVEVCYRAHPFYEKLMKREGIEPRHIQNCDDLVRLPPTTKQDFLADPEAFRMRGDIFPPEVTTLWKVVYTTGTTSGRPAPIYVVAFDYYAYLFGAARRKELIDIRETDVIANLFPLTPFPMGAFSRAADEAAAVGASIVFGHTGRPDSPFPVHHSIDEAVRLVERQRCTVIWGVAGFIRRVLIRAEEIGADFSRVRMAMITGEASSKAMRDDLRRRMGRLGCAQPKVVNRYGSTEQGSSMVECVEGSGFHSLAPDQAFHEVFDPATGRRLGDGESGMLAFTHLIRRGTTFLRFAVGDVVTLSTATCPHCGRTSPRVTSQPVRAGDILKIKGTLVNVQALKEQLEQQAEIDEYQIVIRPQDAADPFSMDELLVRLAARPDRHAALAEAVAAETVRTAHVRPRIEFVDRDDIFDPTSGAKPRRVIDQRPRRD
ncbi:MAG: AMP-binding protein [Variibacter sp.]|nr:AMP-binding protein [Variibacter sp.]